MLLRRPRRRWMRENCGGGMRLGARQRARGALPGRERAALGNGGVECGRRCVDMALVVRKRVVVWRGEVLGCVGVAMAMVGERKASQGAGERSGPKLEGDLSTYYLAGFMKGERGGLAAKGLQGGSLVSEEQREGRRTKNEERRTVGIGMVWGYGGMGMGTGRPTTPQTTKKHCNPTQPLALRRRSRRPLHLVDGFLCRRVLLCYSRDRPRSVSRASPVYPILRRNSTPSPSRRRTATTSFQLLGWPL